MNSIEIVICVLVSQIVVLTCLPLGNNAPPKMADAFADLLYDDIFQYDDIPPGMTRCLDCLDYGMDEYVFSNDKTPAGDDNTLSNDVQLVLQDEPKSGKSFYDNVIDDVVDNGVYMIEPDDADRAFVHDSDETVSALDSPIDPIDHELFSKIYKALIKEFMDEILYYDTGSRE